MMAATAHRHFVAGSSELEDAARDALLAQDVAWTELRAGVFRALAGIGKPASAYDVADAVSKDAGRRVAANSVYRILDLFVSHNLAKRVESRNAYVANTHPDCAHDCIFLVCEDCGRIEHLDDDRLAGEMRAIAGPHGFRAARPVLELIGQCRRCQTGLTAPVS